MLGREKHTNLEESEIGDSGQMIAVVTPSCNKEDVCCNTRHDKKADQVLSQDIL